MLASRRNFGLINWSMTIPWAIYSARATCKPANQETFPNMYAYNIRLARAPWVVERKYPISSEFSPSWAKRQSFR